jgi:serine/threonine protein kinase
VKLAPATHYLQETSKMPTLQARSTDESAMNERQIFEEAVDIPDVARRNAWLDQACAGNAALRIRVEALLASHVAASQFLEVPAVEQLDDPDVYDTRRVSITSGLVGNMDIDDSQVDFEVPPDISFLDPSTKHGSIGRLGHYEVLRVLGQGGFGIVFKAFDEKLQRHVAIKAMNPQLASTSPPRKRFLREARSAAAIKHENIVQVYSVDEEPLPYLVMEFIDGQTLQHKLDVAGPLEYIEILYLGRQMACGLAAAHAQGLIHRDIKPVNILLEQGVEQKVKITDFGLARTADDASMTRTGIISGTPMYMAPEQALGTTLDHRTDLFSLGSVLYQMATGRPPFRAANAIAVLKRVIDQTPRPIREIIPDVPEWLCQIIAKLHAKDPDQRFQSATELVDLLSHCQAELQRNGRITASFIERLSASYSNSADMVSSKLPAFGELPNSSERPALVSAIKPRRATWPLFLVALGITVVLFSSVIVLTLKPDRSNDELNEIPSQSKRQSQLAKVANQGLLDPKTGWHGWPSDAPLPAIVPFGPAEAKQHQDAWSQYLKIPLYFTNSVGVKFVLVPPGEFQMGSLPADIEQALVVAGEDDYWKEQIRSEAPQHKVILTKPFYLGVYEVTQKEYAAVMKTNPSHFSTTGPGKESVANIDTQNFPVEAVTWNNVADFCAKLSQKEDLKPCYFLAGDLVTALPGTGYRMPTEAEWEFACHSGTTTRFWIGDQDESLLTTACFVMNSGGHPHPVGELQANPFGLFDMHGNVWERVEDWWEPKYYEQFAKQPAVNPPGPTAVGTRRVFRGGGWYSPGTHCRSAGRNANDPLFRFESVGFRVVLSVEAVKELLRHQQRSAPVPAG